MKKAFAHSLLIGIALIAGVQGASAQQILRIGYVKANGSAYLEMVRSLSDRVVRATGARVTVQFEETAGSGPQQVAALREGRLDGAAIIHASLAAEAPLLTVGALPGLVRDSEQYRRALEGPLRIQFGRLWAVQYKSELLASGIFEETGMAASKPILRGGDFRGLTMRARSPELVALLRSLGARSVSVSVSESVSVSAPDPAVATVAPVGELQAAAPAPKAISIWDFERVEGWSLVVNQASWMRIDPDLRARIAADLRKLESESFASARDHGKRSLERLGAAGVVIERAAIDERAKALSAAGIDAIQNDWYERVRRAGGDGEAAVRAVRLTR